MSSRRTRVHVRHVMRRAPARLRALSPLELVLLAQAPLLLPLTALALHWYGLFAVQRFVARLPGRRQVGGEPAARRSEAERLAWIVQVSAAYGPWPANCLQRSLLLWSLLHRRGLEAELRIGVRRSGEGRRSLSFHAWIEHNGLVLNDRRDVPQRYATFDTQVVPNGAHFS